MMILLSHIQSPQRETEKIVVAKCSQSKPVKYHSAVLRVGRKKHELVLVKTSRFRLKIPVLDATISDGDGATSREKYPVLIATQNGWKYPQVSFCLETCGDKTQPKHDLQQLKPEQESQNKIVKLHLKKHTNNNKKFQHIVCIFFFGDWVLKYQFWAPQSQMEKVRLPVKNIPRCPEYPLWSVPFGNFQLCLW